jgi:hypothetical protein
MPSIGHEWKVISEFLCLQPHKTHRQRIEAMKFIFISNILPNLQKFKRKVLSRILAKLFAKMKTDYTKTVINIVFDYLAY